MNELLYDPNLVFYADLAKHDGVSFMSDDAYGHLCTVTGATWGIQGRVLIGGDDLINTDSALASLASSTKGTWMVWFKMLDATPTSNSTVISFGDTSATEIIYIYIEATTGLAVAVGYDAGVLKWSVQTDAAAFSDATFGNLALIHNGTAPSILVDGVAVAQTTTVTTDKTVWFAACAGLDNGRIGCYNINNGGNAGFMSGTVTIGDIVLYTRNLSTSEVLDFIQKTKWRYQ